MSSKHVSAMRGQEKHRNHRDPQHLQPSGLKWLQSVMYTTVNTYIIQLSFNLDRGWSYLIVFSKHSQALLFRTDPAVSLPHLCNHKGSAACKGLPERPRLVSILR
jgi:hypothetical protein